MKNLINLQCLKHLDQDKANNVLCDVSSKFLPHPFEAPELLSKDPALVEVALLEIRKVLDLEAADNSENAKRKIMGYLAEEMGKLTPEQEEAAKQRLIAKGWIDQPGNRLTVAIDHEIGNPDIVTNGLTIVSEPKTDLQKLLQLYRSWGIELKPETNSSETYVYLLDNDNAGYVVSFDPNGKFKDHTVECRIYP